jgi:hypothetical protein
MTPKDRFLGLLREILTAGGMLVWGANEGLTATIGLLVTGAALIWTYYHHEGVDVLMTTGRKFLSLLPGVLVHWGAIDPAKAEALAALLLPLFAMIWSFVDKGGRLPTPKGSGCYLFLLAAALALLTPACSNLSPEQNDLLIRSGERLIIYATK